MVIAALVTFGILLLAWIVAPERNPQHSRPEPQPELVGMALAEA